MWSLVSLAVLCGVQVAGILAQSDSYSRENSGKRLVFCYYSSYSHGRPSIGRFTPEDIDPNLCTHVIFAFVNLVDGRDLEPTNWNDVGNNGLYSRTRALKDTNPELKVLLAVGGWIVGSEPFIPMIQSSANRRAFVRNVVTYLRDNGFDGLDMDWEFPGARGSAEDDKYRFTTLLKELQAAFLQESVDTRQEKLLLTMATAGGSYFINKAYETDKIANHVDYLLLMAYNYHGSWNNFTGHHSGLYPRTDEADAMRELNQEWTAEFWEQQGVPRSKLIMGIATYGMSFTLADEKQHGLGAPTTGGGAPGKYTRESGILSYYEICENLKGPWNYVWIEEQKSPYAYYKNQWVGFDDQHSVRYKAEFIRHNGYAGAFIWSVEMEDFRGKCGQGKYPLLTTIYNILRPREDTYRLDSRDRNTGPSREATPKADTRMLAQTPLPVGRSAPRQEPVFERTSRRRRPEINDQSLAEPAPNSRQSVSSRQSVNSRQPLNSRQPVRRIKVTRQRGRYVDTSAHANRDVIKTRPVEMFKCQSPGIHEDPASCDRYFVCIMAGHQWKLYRMKCPETLSFDPATKACVVQGKCS